MRLILNGGTYDKINKESLELFVNLAGGGNIMCVPLAQLEEYRAEYVEWFTKQVNTYGIDNIIPVYSAKDITKTKLKKCSAVFIGGGNTFRLLKELKSCKAFENLKWFLQRKNSVCMGESAGTIIFGKSIETCKDDGLKITAICEKNSVGLEDTSGFDLLNGYSLLVHYKKVEKEIPLVKKRISRLQKEGIKLLCIPEQATLYIHGDRVMVVGRDNVDIFNNLKRESYKPKGEFSLIKED